MGDFTLGGHLRIKIVNEPGMLKDVCHYNALCFSLDIHIKGCRDPKEKLTRMITSFGNFDTIRNVSKRAARIGLLLSSSKCVLSLTDSVIGESFPSRRGIVYSLNCLFF